MTAGQPSTEVTIAAECAAALERRQTDIAARLAEQGLSLARLNGHPKWIRRFEHLLRVATGTPIEAERRKESLCSFCRRWVLMVNAGPEALICDACVDLCARGRLDGSPISLVVSPDRGCSFCRRRPKVEPVFEANGYRICQSCIHTCVEMVG